MSSEVGSGEERKLADLRDELRAALQEATEALVLAIEDNRAESMRLGLGLSRLQLRLEELEGRPESHVAKFARAHLADDLAAMDAARVESVQEYAARYHNRTAAKTTVRAKSAAKNGRATARKAPAAKARKASPRAKSIIAWEDAVLTYAAERPKVTVSDILQNALKKPLNQVMRADENRVGAVLRRGGYAPTRESVDGRRVRFWRERPSGPTRPILPKNEEAE